MALENDCHTASLMPHFDIVHAVITYWEPTLRKRLRYGPVVHGFCQRVLYKCGLPTYQVVPTFRALMIFVCL